MTSDETRLNRALDEAGIVPYETDLADLIIQLGEDRPSHIVVPALHKNRAEIREISGAAEEMRQANSALQTMQKTVSAAFRQRKRLADLR